MSPNKKYEEVLKWTFSFGLDKYRILLTKKFLYWKSQYNNVVFRTK